MIQFQITGDNLIEVKKGFPDQIGFWLEAYFRFEVTTSKTSQKIQKRDLRCFHNFMIEAEGRDDRKLWTPRLSCAFKDFLKTATNKNELRRWSDRTINRILSHLKTFAKWVHKLRPFPLGIPTDKLKLIPVGSSLEIERAITKSERRRILDAADMLLITGGRSRDRRRNPQKVDQGPDKRPRRKGFRAYRNRAIIYTLIETGMRRQAITRINIDDVDFKKQTIEVEEKGGGRHRYQISKEGLSAIRDYIERERELDFDRWASPALFLTPHTTPHGNGRPSVLVINQVWNKVCEMAGVTGKTPHSARHAMGRHIIEKTGNVAAVQRQLGHKNAAYSLQYARITRDELNAVLDER
jgi:integrase